MASIAENIRVIRETMAQAAKAAGREPSEVLLCAATKMNDAAAVREAVAAGVDCCGENRVQELTQKLAEGAYTGKPVHFIGHLQTNKVKQVVGKVDLIESVDRMELLECIEKTAAKLGIVQPILLEVNIGAEESKSGFSQEEIWQTVEKWRISRTAVSADSWRSRQLASIRAIIEDILPKCATFLLT